MRWRGGPGPDEAGGEPTDTFGPGDGTGSGGGSGSGRSSTARRVFTALAVLLPLGLVAGLLWLDGQRADDASERAGGDGGTSAESPETAGGSDSEGKGGSPGPKESDGSDADASERPSPGASGSPESRKSLRGTTVVLDPGHNPGNRNHASEINRKVDIGTARKECDTTGTASNDGYPEATFTLQVARKTRALLEQRGATVELTQDDDRPYGPCIDERARIGNEAKADAVVSVHADGSMAPDNRGFHVIAPHRVRGGEADTSRIVGSSARLAGRLADNFRKATGMPASNYLGSDVAATGVTVRDDLGGLNLSKVPKVFLECGNMRHSKDVALLTDDHWQGKAARGIADGITAYLVGNR
ncbi:N-acetylmuramoyl-L-alanine amidase [Streptomyces sp. XM4193]|uniref:N-acetylmuramoyl-L-alanine amidase n=1 Tax=Streptomyces sp. XM4193 TaxID=2929782 RepID=UPI001FF95FE6|nr:N-acetylmuramoyl-L-alanine amidase [Streptomyces sp. XM4193]MCK1796129.1 N-acetylmuramoyl-L-alanine amidase [Streptomyces sp. XM4193]